MNITLSIVTCKNTFYDLYFECNKKSKNLEFICDMQIIVTKDLLYHFLLITIHKCYWDPLVELDPNSLVTSRLASHKNISFFLFSFFLSLFFWEGQNLKEVHSQASSFDDHQGIRKRHKFIYGKLTSYSFEY